MNIRDSSKVTLCLRDVTYHCLKELVIEHLSSHTLIYIDSITTKVKLVPHSDDSKKNELMCGIAMWEAR